MPTDPRLVELPPFLDGPRVRIRAYQPGDGDDLFAAVDESRAHLWPYMVWVHHHTNAAATEQFVHGAVERFQLRQDLTMGFWDRERGRFLGGTGLHRIDWEVPAFEIGYWVRASEQGRGYVTESARILTEFAFSRLHAERVNIRVSSRNFRSLAIPQRLGYVEEGILRSSVRYEDGLHDLVVFSMLRSEWQNGALPPHP